VTEEADALDPAEALGMRLVVVGASDIGTVREHNEDHFLVGDLDSGETVEVTEPWRTTGDRGPLLVLCDGMGGADGGEVASELASRATWRELKDTPAGASSEVLARLVRRAVRIANADVYAMGKKEPTLHGMGTTLSAAAFAGDRLVVATVGDSRAYILRAGALVQITADQSLQSALLDAGHSPHEALLAGGAILQALGVGEDVEPSLSITELRRGDRLLLCSDGLHGLVGDPALALLMSEPHSCAEAVRLLVAAARAAGGTDNITAIVCQVGGPRFAPPANDDDLPAFREFDTQREGDSALTSTSYVARRLAARIGIPQPQLPQTIPVTGQHRILRSQVGIRLPATELPIPRDDEPEDSPARQRLARRPIPWSIWIAVAIAMCALAWWLGGR
jgi:protein phosphatase